MEWDCAEGRRAHRPGENVIDVHCRILRTICLQTDGHYDAAGHGEEEEEVVMAGEEVLEDDESSRCNTRRSLMTSTRTSLPSEILPESSSRAICTPNCEINQECGPAHIPSQTAKSEADLKLNPSYNPR